MSGYTPFLGRVDIEKIPSQHDRLTEEMRSLFAKEPSKDDPAFDIHAHIFNYDHVPDRFIRVKVNMNPRLLNRVGRFLHNLLPRRDDDWFSRQHYFLKDMASATSETIFAKLQGYYSGSAKLRRQLFPGGRFKEMIIGILPMDFQPNPKVGIRGSINVRYEDQLHEVNEVRKLFPATALPFLAVHPERENLRDIFLKAFTEDKYLGVKIYPSVGYLPAHPNLMGLYAVCEEKGIPITTHCGGGAVRASRKRLGRVPGHDVTEIEGYPSNRPVKLRGNQAFADFFNMPKRWRPVLETFPNLKLNLAHFGAIEAWDQYVRGESGDPWPVQIMELIDSYDGVYTDISFLMTHREHLREVRRILDHDERIRSRTLYGSDYYMTVREGHFRTQLRECLMELGPDLIHEIARVNPRRFLGI